MNRAQVPPAQDCGWFDLGCQGGRAVGEAVASTFDSIVDEVARGAADLIVSTSTWWVETPSVDPMDSAVLAAQGSTRYLIVIILTGSILVQAIRMILSRKAEPMVLVATGLLRFAIVSALGLVLLEAALRAGDAYAEYLLDGAANNFALLMRDLLTSGGAQNGFVILLVALLAAVLGVVQWLLMAIRQAGLLVLAAMLPLAASGSLTKSTRGWLDRIVPWLIAMVVYKPAAALIYYIGFSYLSSPSSNDPGGVGTMLTGVMVLLLAVIAMPVLMRFFAWSGTQVSGGGGGGSGFLGAAGAVAMSQSYQGAHAVGRAASMEASGPGSQPTGAGSPSGAASGAGVAAAARVAGPVGAAAAMGATAGQAAVQQTGDQLTGGQRDGGPT